MIFYPAHSDETRSVSGVLSKASLDQVLRLNSTAV